MAYRNPSRAHARSHALGVIAPIAVVSIIAVFAAPALASPAPSGKYGNFSGTNVTYTDVTEAGSTPLFGSPTVGGNSLDFNPIGFSASSSNGGTGSAIGNLAFGIEVKKKSASRIDSVALSEIGSTTLSGNVPPGSMGTASAAFTSGVLDIHEVDFDGIANISVPFSMTFNPSGGTYFLGTDGGGGPLFNTQFSGSVTLPVQAILVANGFSATQGATDISIVLNNELHVVSEAMTSAFMSKMDFSVHTIVSNPEPTALPALVFAAAGTLVRRRRRMMAR